MSRSSSIASQQAAGRYHFKNAVEILDHNPAPLKRTFASPARDVADISSRLVTLLQEGTTNGTPLSTIDACVVELSKKCLEIQQLTIRARRDGVR